MSTLYRDLESSQSIAEDFIEINTFSIIIQHTHTQYANLTVSERKRKASTAVSNSNSKHTCVYNLFIDCSRNHFTQSQWTDTCIYMIKPRNPTKQV